MSPFDFQTENEAIKRRQAIAQAMMMQGLQQQGGTEFAPGGFAVKRSPLEGIAKMAQTYFGAKGIKGGDDELKALKEQERARVAEAMDSYTQATTPQPEIPMPPDEIGGGPGLPARNPSAEDKRAAAMKLMGSVGDPRDAAKLLVADAMKTPEVKAYKPGDVLYKDGKQVGSIPDRPERPVVAPSAVREYEFAKTQGYQGTFEQWQTNQRKAGATRVNVSSSTEKKYGEQFAGFTAKADVDLLDSARKAPALAERANRIKETLATGKVITGAGADMRLSLGKALNLVGASDAETIANTETLATSMAQNTLDAIKASGLGSGTGFSNADRDFLEKAVGGKINLEAATINRLADLAHRAAEKSAERWSTRVKDIPDSALEGTGIKKDPVKVSPLFQKKKPGERRKDDAPLDPKLEELLKKYGNG